MGETALRWIQQLKQQMPSLRFCCEVAIPSHVDLAMRYGIDALWIGARTTGDPFSVHELAQALRGTPLPVMVKNAPSPDVGLWQGAIERLLQMDVTQVIAVHRGFTAFGENPLRNTPLWEVPIELKRRIPTLTMLCDPSHMAGHRDKVAQLSSAALALGFDGLMVECHPDPDHALTDAQQQLSLPDMERLADSVVMRIHNADKADLLLHDLRMQIDSVDNQLLHLLAQRMAISTDIATIKRNNNISVLQSSRWEQLLSNRMEQGLQIGLSQPFIKDIFEKIHSESVRIQLEKNAIPQRPEQA